MDDIEKVSAQSLRALDQMRSSLEILDECGSPGDVGAHLDLAIARLEQHLGLKLAFTRALAPK